MRIASDGTTTLNVGGVSSTHQFLYNESGGEIQLIDSTGAGPILLDNVSGLARLYKVGTGAMSIGTTGANYLEFITNSSQRLSISSGGFVTANVDMRAPIFYDSDNTSYYLDPSSNTTSLRTNGSWVTNPTSTWGGEVAGKLEYHNNRWYASVNTAFVVRSTTGSEVFWAYNTGVVEASSDFRAPVFYDTNNTAFYANMAGTSEFNTIQTRGGSGFRSFATPAASINSQLYFADAGNTRAWNWQLDENNNAALWNYNGSGWAKRMGVTSPDSELYLRNSSGSDVSLAYPATFGYSSSYKTMVLGNQAYTTVCIGVSPASNPSGSFNGAGSGVEVMFKNGVNFITPNSANNSYLNVMQMTDGVANFTAYATAAGSFRAPIFYDSNNTAYYVDPASTSVLNVLNLPSGSAAINTTTPGTGAYQLNFTAQATPDNAQAITWGWSTSGVQAGIYVQSSGSYGTKMYLATTDSFATGAKTSLAIDHLGVVTTTRNYLQAAASVRAPIFYDSDNTARYFDGTTGINFTTGSSSRVTVYSDDSGLHVANGEGVGGDVRLGAAYNLPGLYNNPNLYLQSESGIYFHTGNTQRGYFDGSSNLFANASMRAPIFYDSNNTNYYLNPESTSVLWEAATYYLRNIEDVSVNHEYGLYFSNNRSTAYAIYREAGAWTSPFPDLRIAFHTGIKMGAAAGYGGMKFYTDYDMSSQVMSINNGADPLGGTNVYVNNSLQAGSSLRAPIFYDSNDTGYYLDLNSTSEAAMRMRGGALIGPNTSYGAYLRIGASGWTGDHSSVFVTNGNLHLDAQPGFSLYLAWYNTSTINVGGSIVANGNITAYSDIRVKDNVETIPNALDKLNQIRGVTYTRTDRDDKERRYAGVIAQEIEKVLPEAIFENEEYKSVDYNATIGLLIQAVKELTDKVKALEAKEQ